jgi:hypothetical protein
MIISLVLLGIGIAAYSISQLAQHDKLRWKSNNIIGYWSAGSSMRKYKIFSNGYPVSRPQNSWYYDFFKLPYKERFPLSATFLVSLTDGYHLMQSISFLSFAGAFSLLSGINFWLIWLGILLVHFTTYRLLQR